MTTDGRVARRQRNQDTVLDAVIALFDAGQLEPAVDDVSELSGVSTRSIYRYFHHRDGLIESALWHLVDRVETDLAAPSGEVELNERLRAFVEHRLSVFARLAPLVRASQRLARPLSSDGSSEGSTEQSSEQLTDVPARRSLFAVAPSVAFAADFDRVDPAVRNIAAISADVMFEFDTLDGLAQALASDTAMMTVVLERHLRQQISLA